MLSGKISEEIFIVPAFLSRHQLFLPFGIAFAIV